MSEVIRSAATTFGSKHSPYEFLVLRQDDATRQYHWLGLLSRRDGEYLFHYTQEAAMNPVLRPLPGFPDRLRHYRSTDLFATFTNRVMTPRRESYRAFLEMIGLSGEVADPFEVLARTWGTRTTDRIQVLPVPRVDEHGRLHTRFLVHGGGHVDPEASRLFLVQPGDTLTLVAEPGNPKDPRAVLVCRRDGVGRLGYVPRPLAPLIQALWEERVDITVTAENVNLPGGQLASNQMRLLAHLEATVSASFDVMAALTQQGSALSLT